MRLPLAMGILVVSLSPCTVVALENEKQQNWYSVAEPDQADWSAKRVANYTQYRRQQGAVPRAILSIPSLNIQAAVFPDTLHGSLEAGVSWVSATAEPGSAGNVAIAGHRDSFFRKLEVIQIGMNIYLKTQDLSKHLQSSECKYRRCTGY